jgi:GNAT superfamily N-acetyltransferase
MSPTSIATTPLPVDAALARRLELAQAEQNRSTTPPAGVLEVAGGLVLFNGARSPLSQAIGLGLSGPVSDEELARVEAHLGQGGGPVQLELTPFADPSLAVLLARRGYRVAEFQQVWVRRLEGGWPEALGVEVRSLRVGEERAWAHAVGTAFMGTEELSPEMAELLLPTTRAVGTLCFGAWVDGELAGGGTVAVHEGVATLSGTGVRERFRRHGVQAALIAARLDWARGQGCTLASSSTLPATPSQRNMERMGFRVAYPKLVMVRELAQG